MFNVMSFITTFIQAILNYDYVVPTYNSTHFSNFCSKEQIFPRIDEFDLKSFSTKNLNCTILDTEQNRVDVSLNKIEWNVIHNGFHTTFKLNFNIYDFNKDKCIYGMYIPEHSFLDISDAQDREYPSPQPPKIHFSPLNQTQFDIQHRYAIPDGKMHEIKILPPNVYCLNNKNEIVELNISKPNKVTIFIPSPSTNYKNVIYYIEILIPIVAVIYHFINGLA